MGAFLDRILAERRARLEVVKARVPLEEVRNAAEARLARGNDRRSFAGALSAPGLRVIAELKQASPSRGLLALSYHPRTIAAAYEAGGAAALSVLTEEQFFRGSLDDLRVARDATRVPVLRKDFIVDEYQIYESAAAGADALLLIVAALDDDDLRKLLELCERLRIDALVEVHNDDETSRAAAAGARIVGVNNRDLRTFEVNLGTSLRLRPAIPAGIVTVSESGIASAQDLEKLRDAGFDAVLIGERLITQAEPGKALAELLGKS